MSESVDPFDQAIGDPAATASVNGGDSARAEARRRAVEHGRALGEHEASSRGQTGDAREQRVARAMAYAAWEFDKAGLDDDEVSDFQPYREEFGLVEHTVTPSLERAPLKQGSAEKKEKK